MIMNITNSRLNYNGQLIKVAAMNYPPWFFGYETEDSFIPTDGTSYRFLQFIARYLNFTWQLVDQKGDWGFTANANGTRSGLIGAIVNEEVEFGIGVPIRLSTFIPEISPSFFIQLSRVTYMTLQAEPVTIFGTIFMPFQLPIWILITILVIVLVGVAFIFEKITKRKFDLKWIVFSSLLQKGTHKSLPKFSGLNFLVQISWWSGLILISSYGSSIISALTDHHKVHNIDTLEEFIEKVIDGRVVPMIGHASAYHYLFQEYKDTSRVYRILSDNIVLTNTFREAMNKMIDARFRRRQVRNTPRLAIMGPYKYLHLWTTRLGEQYFFLRDEIETAVFTDYYGLSFKTNSTLIPYYNRGIFIAREQGFLNKWFVHTKYHWDIPLEELEEALEKLSHDTEWGFASEHIKSLNFENVDELFICFLICTTITLIILCIEIIWKICQIPLRINLWKRKIRKCTISFI